VVGFSVDEDNGYAISVSPRQHIRSKSFFTNKDEMSAIEVDNYIRIEVIKNA
jgi:hypothetical protein